MGATRCTSATSRVRCEPTLPEENRVALKPADEAALDALQQKHEREIASARRDASNARAALKEQTADIERLEALVALHERIDSSAMSPPKWTRPTKPSKGHKAIVVSMLSDLHLDEVVNPDEMDGYNAYNRAIAVIRLERWAKKMIEVSRDYLSGVTYDGAIVMLGGDIFSGNIHGELRETNEDTVYGSLMFWSELLCAALELIVEEFGKLHIPVVVGNHGRATLKPRAKLRARDNIDWVLGHIVARHFANWSNVTVQVTDATDLLVPAYGVTHLLTHGDQVTGGAGVGGIWPPIMRMVQRKMTRAAGIPERQFDVVCMGHWHQLITAPSQGLIVNGALKGYDEYAAVSNFRPERPQQAMWLCTPENGITVSAPILVADTRKREGW